MLTYPKSAISLRVRRIPMHLSLGHVSLVLRKFYPTPNFPQSDLGRRADSRWALPQTSSYKLNCDKIVNLNRQQSTCVSRTKRTHRRYIHNSSVLKECSSVLIPTITNIVNLSLSSGNFHSTLKAVSYTHLTLPTKRIV